MNKQTYFSLLEKDNRALFADLPYEDSDWHTVVANLGDLHKRGKAAPGSFLDLNIRKMAILVGVWAYKDRDCVSSACFDDISVSFSDNEDISTLDGQKLEIGTGIESVKSGDK